MGRSHNYEHLIDRNNNLNTAILGFIIFLIIILDSYAVYGATIHGTIYDVVLNPETNVRLDINTVPHQFFISKNGNYSIDVPAGNYRLVVRNDDGTAEENITVAEDNGEYNIDIILEPIILRPLDIDTNFSEPSIDILNETKQDNPIIAQKSDAASATILLILLLGVIYLIYIFIKTHRAKNSPMDEGIVEKADVQMRDDYGKDILDAIRKNGRMTQKELRKSIPLSEGKISLIITELEHDGKIRKIRKGRGNILIFVKE